MALANYSDLKNAVGNWLNRPDLAAYFADFVTLAEARIYRKLRVRAMEVRFEWVTASGEVTVPADYAQLKVAYIDGSPIRFLQRKTTEFILENYPTRSADSEPRFIGRDADKFIFGPFPDTDYTIKGTYYKRLTALSDNNQTNWFVTNAPDLLLFGALLEAEPFIKNDKRIPIWSGKYQAAWETVEDEERAESMSGSAPRMTVSSK